MLCSNFGKENSAAGYMKCSRGPQVPQLCVGKTVFPSFNPERNAKRSLFCGLSFLQILQ